MKQCRRQLFGAFASLILLAGGGALISCNRDADSPATPDHSLFQSGVPNNFIIGSADSANWGGQYAEDNTYFMVNIPVTGAVKVEYAITGGGTYAVFVETTTPTKWEIGLKTVDGVTDLLERVCVTYTEGAAFASVPANATTATQHQATHYLRTLEDGGTENWWPVDAAFAFAGETKTVCVVTDGQVQGAVVAGPFPKPQPTPVCGKTQGVIVGGAIWYLGAAGQTCTNVCAAHGGYSTATRDYAGTGGSLSQCSTVLSALGCASPATQSISGGSGGCGIGGIACQVGCVTYATGPFVNTSWWDIGQATTADGQGNYNPNRVCSCNN